MKSLKKIAAAMLMTALALPQNDVAALRGMDLELKPVTPTLILEPVNEEPDLREISELMILMNAPTKLRCTINENLDGPNTFTLSWTDNSVNEEGFFLESAPSADGPYVITGRYEEDTDRTTFAQPPGQITYYRVRAYKDQGKTLSDPTESIPITGVPYAPTGLKTSIGSNSGNEVILDWSSPAGNDPLAVEWIIERTDALTGKNPMTFTSKGTTFVDKAPSGDGKYRYRVRAWNSGGRSSWSNASIQPLLAVPTDVTATSWPSVSGPSPLTVNWKDNSSAETGYLIEVIPVSGGNGVPITLTCPANATFGSLNVDLTKAYTVRVRALSETHGLSGYSVPALWNPANTSNSAELPKELKEGLSLTPAESLRPQATVPEGSGIVFRLGSPTMEIGGKSFPIDSVQATAPLVSESGRTLIPIRSMVESFGGTVQWEASTSRILIQLNGKTVSLKIGDVMALVDGNSVSCGEAPRIVNGRTLLPLRFVSENLGLDVQWNETTQEITITP